MRRLVALLVGSAVVGCGPHIALLKQPASPVPLARCEVEEGQAGVVWALAVRMVTTKGLRFESCEDGQGALRTQPTELDAACGATTCLARQYVTVKVGGRAVRLQVRREVWDATWRGWVPLVEPHSQAAAIHLEQELLGELMTQADRLAEPSAARSAWRPQCPRLGPCGPGRCDFGLASAQPSGLPGAASLRVAGLIRGTATP